MRRSTTLLALSAAFTLATLTVTPATAHDAVGSEVDLEQFVPTIEDSRELTSEPLVEGSVQSPEGEALGGTVVTLEAWPSGRELRDLKVGEQIEVATIAKTATALDGSFELRTEDLDLLKRYDDDGEIDLSVVVHGDRGNETFNLSATTDFVNGEVVIEDDNMTEPLTMQIEEPASVESLLARDRELQTKICGWRKHSDLRNRVTTIAQVYSTTSKVTTKVEYSKGSSSSLGAAVNIGTSAVSFTSSGSVSTSYDSSTGYNDRRGVHATSYRKYAQYTKFREYCALHPLAGGSPTGAPVPTSNYQVRPVDLTDTFSVALATSSTPNAPYCSLTETFYEASTGTAVTFSNGVALKTAIGVDLSAKSGYSNGIKIRFDRTSGSSFKVCGTAGKPDAKGTHFGLLVAKA